MKRMKEFILSIDFAVLVFVLIGLRATVMGANVADALIVLSLCGLQGFRNWLDTKKQEPLNEQVTKELEDMKSRVNGLVLKNSIRSPFDGKPPARMF